jgi:hypothetical protein
VYQPRSTGSSPGSKKLPRSRNFDPAYWKGAPSGLARFRYAAASILSVKPYVSSIAVRYMRLLGYVPAEVPASPVV